MMMKMTTTTTTLMMMMILLMTTMTMAYPYPYIYGNEMGNYDSSYYYPGNSYSNGISSWDRSVVSHVLF
uniref:Uncharacterized protein n=1 Tax=Panagrolaimus sp. JU765 TaxID=591449 RepID=A0AC34RA12_9BILA